jgi:IS5 family transposase
MSHQLTFADSEFSTKRRQTRKEIFLSRMEQILPWQNMTAVIEPFYPKAGNGRRPYPLETMLRIHCMQHWYNLSDGAWKMPCTKSPPCACLPDYPWIAARIAPPS